MLTDWFVLQHSKPTQEIAQATIAEIFARFYEHHGQTLVSARDVKRNLNYWLDFHEDATVEEAADQQQQVIAMAKGMQDRKYQSIPFQRDYFGAITSGVNLAGLSGTKMDNFLTMLQKSFEVNSKTTSGAAKCGFKTSFKFSV